MTVDPQEHSTKTPDIHLKPAQGLTDYFCPFCDQKLFRGNVNRFNMVCGNCNRLVKNDNPKELDQGLAGQDAV